MRMILYAHPKMRLVCSPQTDMMEADRCWAAEQMSVDAGTDSPADAVLISRSVHRASACMSHFTSELLKVAGITTMLRPLPQRHLVA